MHPFTEDERQDAGFVIRPHAYGPHVSLGISKILPGFWKDRHIDVHITCYADASPSISIQYTVPLFRHHFWRRIKQRSVSAEQFDEARKLARVEDSRLGFSDEYIHSHARPFELMIRYVSGAEELLEKSYTDYSRLTSGVIVPIR